MTNEIRAGVAGAGVFGAVHARKYAQCEGARLCAIYDIRRDRAEALAALHGAAPYTDYDAFLDAVDLATIAAPATAHYDLARAALDAGRHVLIEKPIALRLDHADDLIALARAKKLVLQVGHQERFVIDALAPAIAPGLRAVICRRLSEPTGRGEDVSVVLDLMIHDLDLVRRLAPAPTGAVIASGDENSVQAALVFADGARATLHASRRAARRERSLTLVYEDGAVEIDFIARRVANTTPRPLAAGFEDARLEIADPLGHGVRRFLAAARAGGEAAIPGEAGRAALEWALAIEARRGAAPAYGEPVRGAVGA